MKRFRFRLARVQKAREISERIARADWLQAEGTAVRAEASATALRARIDEARSELARLQAEPGFSAGAVLASDRALVRVWNSLAAKRRQAEQFKAVAEENRQVWSDRERDRLALERLEQRQRDVHRIEMVRAEDAELDEWAAARRRKRA